MPTAAAWKQAAKQYHNFIGGQIELQHQTEKDYRTLQREHRALRETAKALAKMLVEQLEDGYCRTGRSSPCGACDGCTVMERADALLDTPAVQALLEDA
jgi:hypothetical protein